MRRLLLALLSVLMTFSADAESLQKLLEKQAVALGGWQRLGSVKSYVIRTNLETGGMKGNAVSYFKAPDKIRTDLSLPIVRYIQGCKGVDCWL